MSDVRALVIESPSGRFTGSTAAAAALVGFVLLALFAWVLATAWASLAQWWGGPRVARPVEIKHDKFF